MDRSMVEDNNMQVRRLITISLWAIRRMSNQGQKEFAYEELLKAVGNDSEFKIYIEGFRNEFG